MPEKETLERAAEDKREGKAPSTQAGEFASKVEERTLTSAYSHSHRGFSPVLTRNVDHEKPFKRFPTGIGVPIHRAKAAV